MTTPHQQYLDLIQQFPDSKPALSAAFRLFNETLKDLASTIKTSRAAREAALAAEQGAN